MTQLKLKITAALAALAVVGSLGYLAWYHPQAAGGKSDPANEAAADNLDSEELRGSNLESEVAPLTLEGPQFSLIGAHCSGYRSQKQRQQVLQ